MNLLDSPRAQHSMFHVSAHRRNSDFRGFKSRTPVGLVVQRTLFLVHSYCASGTSICRFFYTFVKLLRWILINHMR